MLQEGKHTAQRKLALILIYSRHLPEEVVIRKPVIDEMLVGKIA